MRYISLAIIFLVFSCQADKKDAAQTSDDETLQWFPNFPEQPFLNLNFNEDLKSVQEKMKESGWQIDSELEGTKMTFESAEFLLSENEKLTEFKVLFFDKKTTFLEDLVRFFGNKAEKMNKTSDFSVYSFENNSGVFDVTLFHFENLIRLHFKAKSWH